MKIWRLKKWVVEAAAFAGDYNPKYGHYRIFVIDSGLGWPPIAEVTLSEPEFDALLQLMLKLREEAKAQREEWEKKWKRIEEALREANGGR